ncbi:MAG: hypothetical protein FWG32_09725, partial [Oscillospiraceae bacterium]|nr:hypothetical protein [Oscillospiraceae bacterium]
EQEFRAHAAGTNDARADQPEGKYSAAMYKDRSGSFSDYYEFVLANKDKPYEINKSYFSQTLDDGNVIDILFDRILHGKNEHNMTAADYEDIFSGLVNISEAYTDSKVSPVYDGIPVKLKINTPSGPAGVILEYLPKRIILRTAFIDSDKGIDAWINKGAPAALQADFSGTALSAANSFTVDSIRDLLEKSNTNNAEVRHGEEVHIRAGGERSDGEDTRGLLGGVEENAGGIQGGEKAAGAQAGGKEVGYGGNESGGRDRKRALGVAPAESGAGVSGRAESPEAGRAAQRLRAQKIRAAVEASGSKEVSAKELGIPGGSQSKSARVAPESLYTDEMRDVLRKNKAAGRETVFFTGILRATVGGKLIAARAAISPDGKIKWLKADHPTITVTQFNAHEDYHDLLDKYPGLYGETVKAVAKHFGPSALNAVAEEYIKIYGWTDVDIDYIFKEVLADSNAGIVISEKADATVFSDVVKGVVSKQNAAATDRTTGPPEGGANFSRQSVDYDTETAGIKKQLKANQNKLNEMGVVGVADVPRADTSKHGWKQRIKPDIFEFFKRLGNKINRANFGDVIATERELNKALNYIETEAEAAAFYVAHKVIKQGIEISRHTHHKGGQADTVTFAAPVKLNNKPGNMAVVVKQTGKSRYKTHRILTPEGKMLVFDDAETQQAHTGTGRDSQSQSTPTAYTPVDTTIHHDDPENKPKFSMETPVEEVKDLIALHNLTEAQFAESIKLGGFAMPSVAVVRAEQGHSRYGDISVVFGKDTIDPKLNKKNEIYGADAWTPTFPQIGYEITMSRQREIEARLASIISDNGLDRSVMPDTDPGSLAERLERSGGEAAKSFEGTRRMQVLFLAETHPELLGGEKNYYKLSDKANEAFDKSETPLIKKEYSAWLKELFDGLYSRRGIRNNADMFTEQGNRKSFGALHDEYNLKNLVKAMAGSQKTGGGSFAGTGAVIGAGSKRYAGIDDVRADKERLRPLPQTEYDALMKGVDERVNAVMEQMAGKWDSDVYEVIVEALNKGKTEAGVFRVLREYSDW